ncbi:outer membrane beta-barrel protein [Flavobacterium sp. PL002]|uniref:outer membrane beta-barrel protein n=1 Tax=Flavobacterium sp. PL002 TaxID=1897058 RepID=UPI001787DA27|nr:outer membrane beta-barrel protein [Flavobacterium sp. PL002]MBE0392751.1 hypothetical protein [Flavobacterium sp. PL002]
MKKTIYLLLLSLSTFGFAQVKDISFTASPFVDYTFYDKQSGLENATSVGGKIGFGFGEYVEIRAVYMQSLGLKTRFSDFGITSYNEGTFQSQDVDLTRWGGEFKTNLGKGRFIPYLTLGSGVQNIAIKDGADFDQIYTSLGLGFKTKLTDRIVFTIEGKYNNYNFNAGENLLTEQNKNDFGVTNADFETNGLTNWSAQASLQFYLGGRKPGTMSELDKAYYSKFSNGFKGIQWIIEPSINYIKFDDKSLFKDTYLMGLYAGFDFNQYTGIRAFYLQASENEQISTSFDHLSMYGLEFRARLNDGNGVTPYLILGGGILNTQSDYLGKTNTAVDSEEFASAGLGLNIPLSKHILITGGARGMITSAADVTDLSSPDNLQTHIMYNAGIKLSFGGKKTNPDTIYVAQLSEQLNIKDKETQVYIDEKIAQNNADNTNKIATLKQEYQDKLDGLETDLEKAKANDDIDKAVVILEQKKTAQNALEEVAQIEKKAIEKKEAQQLKVIAAKQEIKTVANDSIAPIVNKTVKDSIVSTPVTTLAKESATKTVVTTQVPATTVKTTNNNPVEYIRLTPAELESLIDQVMETDKTNYNNALENEKIKKRVDVLEKALLEKNKPAAKKK